MKKFWNAIGVGLAKLAVWAVEHPDKVLTVVNVAKAAKK
jgi:hypothetical protein